MNEPTAREWPWRAIGARVVLVGGLAAAFIVAWPRVPHDQVLVFRVEGDDTIVRLDASWTRADDDVPTGGVTFAFPDEKPVQFRHDFSAPNGEYDLAVHVTTRNVERPEVSFSRTVTLSGNETIIPLRFDGDATPPADSWPPGRE